MGITNYAADSNLSGCAVGNSEGFTKTCILKVERHILLTLHHISIPI